VEGTSSYNAAEKVVDRMNMHNMAKICCNFHAQAWFLSPVRMCMEDLKLRDIMVDYPTIPS
jgi:hypothetical protein